MGSPNPESPAVPRPSSDNTGWTASSSGSSHNGNNSHGNMSSRQEVFISYRGWPEHRHPLFTQQDATDNLNGTHWSKGLESWSPSLGGPFRGLNTSPLRPYPNRDLLAEAGWYDTTGKKGHLKEYAPSPQEEVSSCLQRSLESEALVSRFTEDDSWPSDCGKVEGTPTATSPWTVTPPEHSEEKAKELEHAQSFDLKDFAYFYDHDGRDHASTHLEGHALPKTPISQPAFTKTAPVLGPSKVWALPPVSTTITTSLLKDTLTCSSESVAERKQSRLARVRRAARSTPSINPNRRNGVLLPTKPRNAARP